jgi:hypothetical protein
MYCLPHICFIFTGLTQTLTSELVRYFSFSMNSKIGIDEDVLGVPEAQSPAQGVP